MDEHRQDGGNDRSKKSGDRWWNSRPAVVVIIAVWLLANYGKARIYTDSAWEAIGTIVLAYGAVAVLTWAWIYGGKLREREEQKGPHDPPLT